MSDQNPISLRSPTLPIELRSPTLSDASALLALFTDPVNVAADPSLQGATFTLEKLETMIDRWNEAALAKHPGRVNLVVVDNSESEGKVVGTAGMGHIERTDAGRSIGDAGVMLFPEAQGKGYAYEAMRLTIDFAYKTLNLDKVTSSTLESNGAMRGLLESKFGLVGERRKCEVEAWGWEYIYVVKKEEWLSRTS